LETGKIISRSVNADEVYFGASASKLFVTAALLNKQDRQFDSAQLTLNEIYGLAILSNTGSGEDVAILGGGLMR
jgi:hypothetical protein